MTTRYTKEGEIKVPLLPSVKRRVTVSRKSADALNKQLEGARTGEALNKLRAEMDEHHLGLKVAMEQDHALHLTDARIAAHEKGVEAGKVIAMADYETQLDESINNRLCDNERDLPWPVGVIIAGEQHRILQALADYLDDGGVGGAVAQQFAAHLGIINAPVYLDAPSPVTFRNCEEPPKHKDYDQKGNQIQLEQGEAKLPGYTSHWQYYLRQLDDKG